MARGLERPIGLIVAVALGSAAAGGLVVVKPTLVWAALGVVALSLAVAALRRPVAAERSSAAVGLGAAVVLCGAVPAAFILSTPGTPYTYWYLALAVTVTAGARLAWIVGVGEQRLFEMVFWLFTYIFLGLAPLVQLRLRINASTTDYVDHGLGPQTMYLVLVGMAAVFAGSTLRSGSDPGRVSTGAPRTVSIQRVLVVLSLGIAVSAYYVSSVGIGSLFRSRGELSQVARATLGGSMLGGLARPVATMTLLVAFVALLQLRRSTQLPWTHRVVLPAVAGVLLLIVVNPISSPRYIFGTVILSMLTALGLTATRRRFRVFVMGSLAGLLLVFPLADLFRRTTSAALEATSPVQSLLSGDFDAFDQTVNAVSYVEGHGTTWGRQALGVVLFWFPRSFWPGKPQDTGVVLATDQGYAFKNLSAPIWAELHVNGGWLAVVVGMFLLGVLLRRLDGLDASRLRAARELNVLQVILPFYMLFLLRGSLLQATDTAVVILVAALFVQPKVRTRQTEQGQPGISSRERPGRVRA